MTVHAKNDDMATAYEPQEVEQRLYQMWVDGEYFTPIIDKNKDPFVIVMPPPNVTGELHLGHALTATLEDIMVRWHRMKGDPTLWLPGADHAGIATQVVVERSLASEGLTRQDIGRSAFVERIWQWVNQYGNTIDEQHKRVGASCDWTRKAFTLDHGPSRAVKTTFVNLFEQGLIYRGRRIINWCPRCSTALSDLEVEHQEEQSNLYYIRYTRLDGLGYLVVATTRPETLFGDAAIAVNPADIRYMDLVGKKVLLPILNRGLVVIGDESVDLDFGTGALKITPGHDPVDFEVGQRHGLPTITVIGLDGTMNAEAGPYAGKERFECRELVLKDLASQELIEKIEPYTHSVGHCGRCGVAVEPMVSKQWFMKMGDLAKPAMEVVRDGTIKMIPERFGKVYLNWMENIKDWCISRQIWWGHRIPAWYCLACYGEHIQVMFSESFDESGISSGTYNDLRKKGMSWEYIESHANHILIGLEAKPLVDMELPEKCPSCGSGELIQDPDVLDTWFSSALWPHSTLGWPDNTQDENYFYPGTVMETGYDILFFWVARMIMMGIANMGEIPFSYVYLHGLVRDEKGLKMSKTRGNVIDPINAIDVYGTDALRFSLTTGNAPGNDMRVSEGKLGASRNFINKVWNASRFVLNTLSTRASIETYYDGSLDNRHDKWIVSRMNRVVERVNRFVGDFQFGEAQREIHDFFWNDFCDWYIEMVKIRLRSDRSPSAVIVLTHVLETSLRLMHPFIPFVTEEIWQKLKRHIVDLIDIPEALIVCKYPEVDIVALDDQAESEIALLTDVVRSIRNIRAEFKIPPNQYIKVVLVTSSNQTSLSEDEEIIRVLARVDDLSFRYQDDPPYEATNTVTAIIPGASVFIPLEGLVDTAIERGRLEAELVECETNLQKLSDRLNSPEFQGKAPQDVIERERNRRDDLADRMARIQEYLVKFSQ